LFFVGVSLLGLFWCSNTKTSAVRLFFAQNKIEIYKSLDSLAKVTELLTLVLSRKNHNLFRNYKSDTVNQKENYIPTSKRKNPKRQININTASKVE
jgi:hypothetical protein